MPSDRRGRPTLPEGYPAGGYRCSYARCRGAAETGRAAEGSPYIYSQKNPPGFLNTLR